MSRVTSCSVIFLFIIFSLTHGPGQTITNWKIFDQRKLLSEPYYTPLPYFLPNDKNCICVPLVRCLPLYNLLSNRPVHPLTIEFLRNQTCAFHGPEPYVCCYEYNNPTSSTPPNVPQPRIEKCLVSPTEASSNEIESTPGYFETYPKFRPYHGYSHDYGHGHGHGYGHHGYDPHHYGYHHDRDTFYPYHSNNDDVLQEDLTTQTTTSAALDTVTERSGNSNGTITPRNRLLPDGTCGLALNERIVGGRDVRLGGFPWMARIGYTRANSAEYLYRCGGTLITARYVITAAHCTVNLPSGLNLATVRLGELDERTNPDCEMGECADAPQDFSPITVISHRDYDNPKYKNDISLLRLDRTATITAYVTPICLPFDLMKSTNYSGIQATVAGWGVVSVATRSSSPTLQQAQLRISDNNACSSVYASRFQLNVTDEQLCTAGLNGEDACEGDSGGPLMRLEQQDDVPRYFLLGVVSFGPTQCGTSGWPSVYTRVTHYLDWILRHIDEDTRT